MLEHIDPKALDANFFSLLDDRWGILTVADGERENPNPMTVSWGGVGILWGEPVVTVYVRPQRYTRHLIDGEEYFSLSFLPKDKDPAAALCGSKSGRDTDKVKDCGFTVLKDEKAPYFAQSELTLICRKLYEQDLDPAGFVDQSLDEKNYPAKDYHRMYIGKIEQVLVNK